MATHPTKVSGGGDVPLDTSDDNIDNNEMKPSTIEDPLLAYVLFSMQSGSVNNIKKAVAGHFTAALVIAAKDKLWVNCEE